MLVKVLLLALALCALVCAVPIGEGAQDQSNSHDSTLSTTPQSGTKSNVVVVSVSIGPGAEYGDLTEENHRQYASRHGFEYKRFRDQDLATIAVDGDPKWSKMKSLDLLLDGSHKLVVWLDSDMVVTNMDQSHEKIFSSHARQSTDLIVARDGMYNHDAKQATINSGCLILRDSAWSKELVQTVLRKGKVPGSDLEDQPRLILELKERGELDVPATSMEESHEHVVVVKPRLMNSFAREGYEDGVESSWQKGDFIAHVCGMPTDRRQSIIHDLLKNAPSPARQSLLAGLFKPGQSDNMWNGLALANTPEDWEKGFAAVDLNAGFGGDTLDKIEKNWRVAVLSSLVKQDWATVESLLPKAKKAIGF